MSNDAICPMGEEESDNGICQSQPITSAPPQVSQTVVSRPGRRATLSLGHQDRLERLWLAIERAGEYERPDDAMNQHGLDVSSGGAA
jgi:hypothetical protein